jgi:transposase-like protein
MAKAVEMMSETERWRSIAWTDQRTPALAIVARGDQIRSTGPTQWTVCSQSQPGSFHHVEQEGARWKCDCPFFSATSMTCVHIVAVRYQNGLQDSAPALPETRVVCDSCGSPEVVCRGIRRNKSGDAQTYVCKSCGRRFVGRGGFSKRRADPMNIARSLDLYFRGMSIRKVREYLEQVERLSVSHMTIYRWVVHYSKLASEWMDTQGARTSDRWHIDETVVNVNGKNEYLWNVLDHETRFLLATHVSDNRSLANTRTPLRRAKAVTPDRPVDVLSDGMNAYPLAVGKELGRKATALDDPKHVQSGRFNPHKRVPSIRAPESNNRIERFHGTEKERFKVMRAFDGEPGTAVLAEGLRVHYNLVREHQALGMTPGEAAGIPTGNGFKWLAILTAASSLEPFRPSNGNGNPLTPYGRAKK